MKPLEVRRSLNAVFKVVKSDEAQRIVFGEVYAPGVLDSHGEMMTAEEVAKMAHRFMAEVDLSQAINIEHTKTIADAVPVESFIARENDPDFTPGAWVMAVKINDPALWEQAKAGELNGYSWEAWVYKTAVVGIVESPTYSIGMTEPDPEDGHTHYFVLSLNTEGRVAVGRTSSDNGHSHVIQAGTATEAATNPLNGKSHAHRFFLP